MQNADFIANKLDNSYNILYIEQIECTSQATCFLFLSVAATVYRTTHLLNHYVVCCITVCTVFTGMDACWSRMHPMFHLDGNFFIGPNYEFRRQKIRNILGRNRL